MDMPGSAQRNREKTDSETDNNSEKAVSPSTADDNRLMQWGLLCILSGLGLIGMMKGFPGRKSK